MWGSLLATAAILLAAAPTYSFLPDPLGRHAGSFGSQDAARSPRFAYTAEADADRVTNLPGLPAESKISLFSGYITVDESAGRALFYTHVEAESEPAAKPLVLWLNGGPGCSSIGGGFLSELGPFWPNPDGKTLQANPWGWQRFANLVFLESPAFVGFSYSNTSDDKVVGDARTALDSDTFLRAFLKRFPHFAAGPVYITGESYGGHYVPQLAWQVLQGNQQGRQPAVQLEGIAVGNAWTDARIDNTGCVDFWWSHGLISDDVAHGIKNACNLSDIGPLYAHAHALRSGLRGVEDDCDAYVYRAMGTFDVVNIYEIYADVCQEERAVRGMKQLARQLHRRRRTPAAAGQVGSKSDPVPSYDPCVDGEVQAYLNQAEVQAALHARPVFWQDCTDEVDYSWEDLLSSVLPLWHKLLQQKLKVLVYSGDVDGIVPVVGSRRWVANLGLSTVQDWVPWVDRDGQVGGFVQFYDKLTFATVRNAGHMVPYTQPDRAFTLLSWFIPPIKPQAQRAELKLLRNGAGGKDAAASTEAIAAAAAAAQ